MSIPVSVVFDAQKQALALLTAKFTGTDVQVIFGHAMAEDYQRGQIVSVGAADPADTDVDWSSLGNYRRQERFDLELQVQLWLPDQPDQGAAHDSLKSVTADAVKAINVTTVDLGLRALLSLEHCLAVVTGVASFLEAHPAGGFLARSSIRVSVEARVKAR